MPDVTVNAPSVGLEAYFTFKDPINYYIRNKYNLNSLAVKLKVISVISMRDMIRSDLRDPFTELYDPAKLTEVDYKKDLLDNIPIISFSYTDRTDVERYIRSPLNYIDSVSNISNKEYINKLLVIDLNRLPKEFDTSIFFADLADFVESRLGIVPQIKEVAVGEVEMIDTNEHDTREEIRKNMVSVYKTQQVRLEELQLEHNQVMQRLATLGISLGMNPNTPEIM